MTASTSETLSLNLDKTTWKRVCFGAVVRNVNKTVKDPDALGIDRIIAMEHLDPGELKILRWGDLASGTTFTRRVRPGQTLFGKRRAYQRKAAFADFDAICSGDILVFEADTTQMLPEFLPFLVQSDGFYDHALGTSAGSLSPRTNWRDLSNYEFDLPPLGEQARIAGLFWAAERHGIALANDLSVTRAQRLRYVNQLVDRALSDDAASLSTVAEIRGGIQKGKRLIGAAVQRPYLRVANVQAGRLDLDEVKTIPVSPADAQRYLLESGDVLMTEGGDIDKLGRGTVWHNEIEGCLHQNHVFAVRPNPERVLPEWISIHTESEHGLRYFRVAAKRTSNLATVNKKQVSAFPVGVVPLADQCMMLEQVAKFDRAVRAIESELVLLRELRNAFSFEVFGGAA